MAQYKQNQVDVDTRFRARSQMDQNRSSHHFVQIKNSRARKQSEVQNVLAKERARVSSALQSFV